MLQRTVYTASTRKQIDMNELHATRYTNIATALNGTSNENETNLKSYMAAKPIWFRRYSL